MSEFRANWWWWQVVKEWAVSLIERYCEHSRWSSYAVFPGISVGYSVVGSGWLLKFLLAGGIVALLYYLGWWFSDGIAYSPWLLLLLPAAAAYATVQLLGNWIIYLRARQRSQLSSELPDLTIDVFVTACCETPELVEHSLAAACAMECAHLV